MRFCAITLRGGTIKVEVLTCGRDHNNVEVSFIKVLILGAGGVGSSMVSILSKRNFISECVIADRNLERAEKAVSRVKDSRFSAALVNCAELEDIRDLIRRVKPKVVVNAVDPRFVMPIFLACEIEKVNYLDMAMSLSRPHPHYPFTETGVKLGDEQFARDYNWEEKSIFALIGMGVEPGLSDIFAKYASDELFSSIEEITVLDGSNIVVEGYDFAPSFSIWTTIEECLNPPIHWEDGRGWYTSQPLTGEMDFEFPEDIGTIQCVDVEHEEVVLIPQKIDAKKVSFKYGLGDQFISILKTIHILGFDKKEEVEVHGVKVSPRELLVSNLPDPAQLGEKMKGKTCAGVLIKGLDKNGAPIRKYLYQIVDNSWSMENFGDQAVVWQTALCPVIALELISEKTWSPVGVVGPEWLNPKPFLKKLEEYGVSWSIVDR